MKKIFFYIFLLLTFTCRAQTAVMPVLVRAAIVTTQTFTQLGTMVYNVGSSTGGTTNTGGSGNDGKIDITSIGSFGIIEVVVTGLNTTIGSIVVSDNVGNTYTLVRTQVASGGTSEFLRMYHSINPTNTSAALQLTVAGTGTFSSIAASAWRCSQTPVLDQQNSAILDRPGSTTPTVNGELIFTSCSSETTVTAPTVGAPFASPVAWAFVSGVHYGGGLSYYIQATAASLNPIWTNGNTAMILTYK